MNPFEQQNADILAAARERGREAFNGNIPAGLSDHLLIYTGLISSGLELAKLIQTEERDMAVIQSHYQISAASITAEFQKLSDAMQVDYALKDRKREDTKILVDALMAAGQYETAVAVHQAMLDSTPANALENLLKDRNNIATDGSKLSLKY